MSKQKCIRCNTFISDDKFGCYDGLLCENCFDIAVRSMIKQSPLHLKVQDIKSLFSAGRIGNHTGRVSRDGRATQLCFPFDKKTVHPLKT